MSRSPAQIVRRGRAVLWMRNILCGSLLLVGIFTVVDSVVADDSEVQFLNALRDRRFFDLAELHCQRALNRKNLQPPERSLFLLEYSKTLAAHAMHAPPDEQADLWDRAVDVLQVALKKESGLFPQHAWLMAQRAFVLAQRASALRLRRELDPAVTQQTVLDAVKQALSELQLLNSEYEDGRHAELAGLTGVEKRSLRRGLQLMTVRMFVERARLHAPTEPDFAEALLAADRNIKPLAIRPSETQVAWDARVLQATIARLRDELSVAQRLLKNLVDDVPPPRVARRVLREQMYLSLQQGQPDAALTLLIDMRRQSADFTPDGESLFLKLRAIHELREQAFELKKTPLAEKLGQQQQSVIHELKLREGGYWLARAQVFLKRAAESLSFGPEIARLIKHAREDFAVGNYAAAIAGYQQAAEQTRETGRQQLAAEFVFTAASIALDNRKYQQAAQEFERLYSTWPDSDRAERAHLLLAWCRGQLYAAERTAENRRAYTAALEQHCQAFAERDSKHDAVVMLAELQEQRLQHTKALALYESIVETHPRFPDAQLGIVRCSRAIMRRLTKIPLTADQRTAWETRAKAAVVKVLQNPEHLSDEKQAIAQTGLAAILLLETKPDYEAADEFLRRAAAYWQAGQSTDGLSGSDGGGMNQQLESIHNLRIISSAGVGDYSRANKLCDRKIAVEQLEFITTQLARIPAVHPDAPIVSLRLRILQQAIDRADNEKHRTELESARIKLLGESGRLTEAMQKYRSQIAQDAGSVTPRRELAKLLEMSGGRKNLLSAQREWQRVEKLLRGGSNAWCEARYNVARLSLALNKVAECRKLIQVTRVLYPDCGTDELRQRFLRLESKANKANP